MTARGPTAKFDSSASGGVAAVDRALSILTTVESSDEALSLSELSGRTGLYKSTILRLIVSLERAALIVQRPDLRYELGPRSFQLGRAYGSSRQLEERVFATLQRLVDRDTQSASFHMRYDEHRRLCLFRVNSYHSTLDNVKTGDLLTLAHGAPAKVIRHFHPLSGQPLNADKPLVFSSFGERDPLCAAIACPVFAAHDLFVGAVSLSGPRERFDAAEIERMSDILIVESRALTHALGGDWPANRG